MQHKPSPPTSDVQRELLKSGVLEDALPAVMTYLETEHFLEPDSLVAAGDLLRAAVAAGVRQFEVLEIDRAGRQEASSIGRPATKTQRGESAASVHLRILAQRLVLKELSQHPRVRAWRREHLGGEEQLMSWEEADRWILADTEPISEKKSERYLTTIYWDVPGDIYERTVIRGSSVASLLDLEGFLREEAGWEERDARRWVLVGQRPPIRMARIRTKLRRYDLAPTIVLEASVWLSDREVVKHFRDARSLWVSRRPAPKQKVIDMANFRLDNPKLTWQDCWRRWNEAHPTNRYSDPATMKRSYFGLRRSLRQLRRAKPQIARRRKRTNVAKTAKKLPTQEPKNRTGKHRKGR